MPTGQTDRRTYARPLYCAFRYVRDRYNNEKLKQKPLSRVDSVQSWCVKPVLREEGSLRCEGSVKQVRFTVVKRFNCVFVGR